MRFEFALSVAVFLCGCSTTFDGRVLRPNGQPVAGAHVEAAQYPSLLGSPPWQWFPARYVRGTAITDARGTFSLHATTWRIDELAVRSAAGVGYVRRPSSRQPLTITLHSK